MSFLAELKRRKVVRVAAVYGATAFVVWQAADIAFPALHMPGWTVTGVVALTIIGFPLAVVLAWAFDVTPAGVVRTDAGGGHVVVSRTTLRTHRIAAGAGVLILALAGGAFVAVGGRDAAAAAELDRSIAVLPFANLSGDADNEYFSDGITEDVLAHISRIADLKVISRTSVMGYKGTTLRLREIGEELGVAHVLEGSVRREGNRVRIVAQLIHARTDQHLWTETYDRELTGIFQIQSEIAQQIATALQARLSPVETTRIASVARADLTAYDFFLRAREYLRSGRAEDRETATALLRQAIDLDPHYAPAWAELARAYLPLREVSRARLDSAMTFARTAVELAPEQAEGHGAVALVLRRLGRNSEAAESYERAYELNPNDASSIGGLGFAHVTLGRTAEALRWFLQAVALDPTTATRHRQVAFTYEDLGEDAAAEQWYGQAARLAPDNPLFERDLFRLHLRRGEFAAAAARLQALHRIAPDAADSHNASAHYYLRRGDTAAAFRHFQRAAALDPDQPPPIELAFLHRQRGEHEPAEAILRAHEERTRSDIASGAESAGPFRTLARIHTVRGERDEAIRQLEEGVRRHMRVHWVADDPLLDLLRDEPRFRQIVAQLRAEQERQRQRVRQEGWG